MWYHPVKPIPDPYPSKYAPIPAKILHSMWSGKLFWDLDIINLQNGRTLPTQIKPQQILSLLSSYGIKTHHYDSTMAFNRVLQVLTNLTNQNIIRMEWKYDPQSELYQPFAIQGSILALDNALRYACGLMSVEEEGELEFRHAEFKKMQEMIQDLHN